jgi:hypothetical protein
MPPLSASALLGARGLLAPRATPNTSTREPETKNHPEKPTNPMPPSTDKPLTFPAGLRVNGRAEPAQIRFAGDADVKWLSEWQTQEHEADAQNEEHKDALEYAALTFKFYSLYKKSKNLIQSLEELEQTVEKESPNSRNDLLFTLVLERNGTVLGYAAIRRTWKNTLKLEYLFRIPQKPNDKDNIKWIGNSLLIVSIFIAEKIHAPMLWGESSSSAVGLYQKKGFDFFEEIFYLRENKYQSFLITNTKQEPAP